MATTLWRAGAGGVKPLIDDATLHQWNETGARTIGDKLSQALKATAEAPSDAFIDPTSELYRLFYELVWVVVHAKLTRQDVVTVLKDADLASYSEAVDTFLDLIWVIGNEIETNEKGRERHSSPEWQQLYRFVQAIADDNVVPAFALQASLEYELLHAAGLVSAPPLIRKKILRINTKALYTQMKYNLLREESEGFAKVLTLLHTNVTPATLDACQTDLLALIGYFDLDANRVLDLVLDAYERQPLNTAFASLLGAFKRASLPHVLGFKFQFYMRSDTGVTDAPVTPRSLYRLAATLIAKQLVDVDALLPHLAPTKDAIVAREAKRVQQLQADARAFGKVNLAAKPTDADSSDKAAAAAAAEAASDAHNQVFGLIVGMLEIGSDAAAFDMIAWFQARGVDPLAYKPLTVQLCKSVHALIVPLYAPLSRASMQLVACQARANADTNIETTPHNSADVDDVDDVDSTAARASPASVTPLTTRDELVRVVFPILAMLGAHLHEDALLFTKLVRIISPLVAAATKHVTTSDDDKAFVEHVQQLITTSFLPAVAFQGSNPSAVFQLWDLVKLYPFEQRYRMYEAWQTAYAQSAELTLIDAQVVQATRKVLRRLTADRAKPSARSLTHFAHSNPLVVFRTMLRQIQSYDNLIQPVVESCKFVTPLGFDVLSFVLVRELARSRQAMKADGTNVSLWLASLASFAGSFYRKYPTVELSGLLQYLIARLSNWESVDLVVLSELLTKMGSCIVFEDISLSQLEAHAGGPHLWHEPADPKLMNRRAIPRLRDALVKRELALPLCLLICQMRSRIEHHESAPRAHLKLLGRVYDTCQMTLSQLLQFLNGVVDPSVYTAMLPSLTALVTEYHIVPELAMTLCRPAMRFHDPVLRRAPRSIHATGSSTTSDAVDAASGKRWFMDAPELIADIASAVTSADGRDPFVGVTKHLYATFWSLVLYDIHVPFAQYETEIGRLRASLTAAGGANNPAVSPTERKKLREKTSQMIDRLTTEQKDQVAHRKRVFERLEAAKTTFFARERSDARTAVLELLQRCVIPRALLSPEDALFCVKFIERLHALDTPEFSTLQYYNTVNLKLPALVLCVTEREAGNFGIFLKESVTLLHRWYQSSVAYEEDALHGSSGFSVDLHDPSKKLPHRQYKLAYAKWHKATATVFAATLASSEYMPLRNSLIVLTKVIDVFPASTSAAARLLALVHVLTTEEREDIKIMAKRYFALLTKRKATLVDDKLLAIAAPPSAKKPSDGVAATPLDSKRDNDDNDDNAAAQTDKTSSLTSDAGKRNSSSSASSGATESMRDRKASTRVLRQDLESGEISSPTAASSSASAAASSVSSSRRSNERSAASTDRERDSKRSSSSGSRLKRRDSDRVDENGAAAARSSSSSSRQGEEKRGRRDRQDNRDRQGDSREHREASPGKPPLASATPSSNSRASAGSADAPAGSGRKRDRSRERRSRSAEGRRNGRERGDTAAPARSPAPAAAAASMPSDRNANSSNNASRPVAAAAADPSKRANDDADGENRSKRQRVELSEAALRRQLTEKKDQVRRERVDVTSGHRADASARSNEAGSGTTVGATAGARSGVDAMERPQASPVGSVRKIVSLVSSSSRKREESDRAGSGPSGSGSASVSVGVAAAVESGDHSDDRRRRDSGRGGGQSSRDGHGGGRGGGDGESKQRGMQDDKKKLRLGRKTDSSSSHVGGGGHGGANLGANQQQQQREQSRGGNGGGHDRRSGGGGGSGGQGRGNDGGGRGNDERGGGAGNGGGGGAGNGGGGGRRRDDRRGGRR